MTKNKNTTRFVIQKHSRGDDVHWDLMLEAGPVLETWRLDKSPQELLRSPAGAEKIFDHPLKFLTYEGPVNQGQSQACIVESGTYRTRIRQSAVAAGS